MFTKKVIVSKYNWFKVIVSFIVVIWFLVPYAFIDSETITVNKTERVDDRYLVFTDKGVYENVDSVRMLKFNSSDIYSRVTIGKIYIVSSMGIRIPLFSMYKNIIEIEEINSNQ